MKKLIRNIIAWLFEFLPLYGVIVLFPDGKEEWILESKSGEYFLTPFIWKAKQKQSEFKTFSNDKYKAMVRRYR